MTTKAMSDDVYINRINFWGRITVGLGLILAMAAPIYLFTVEGLFPGWVVLGTCFLAVAVIYAANWIVEPATYFPMLGVSGTYQAWLVGNISNKLLPASVTAQAAVDAKPGTKKAELTAVAAISGAVIVHVAVMILAVAIFGNWIIAVLPESVRATFGYILPAIIGAVFVQLAVVVKSIPTTLVSLVTAAGVVFAFAPAFPDWTAFSLPIVVLSSVAASMFFGSRAASKAQDGGKETVPGRVEI